MPETLLEELKRYVHWSAADESALRALKPAALPHLKRISEVFYDRILEHEGARKALKGESQVGHLKVTLVAWMDKLLTGPWDEEYYELRARIGRMHVRIALPQHYMMGAMNVLRTELHDLIHDTYRDQPETLRQTRSALARSWTSSWRSCCTPTARTCCRSRPGPSGWRRSGSPWVR